MFRIFIFERVGWPMNKGLWANSVTALTSGVISVWSASSEARELPGFGFTEETAEKRMASFGSNVVGATAMMWQRLTTTTKSSWSVRLSEEHQHQSLTSYVSISEKGCTLDIFFLNSYHKQLPWKWIYITLLYILSISPLKFIFCQNLTCLWFCFLVFHSSVIILQSRGHCWWTAATLLTDYRSGNQGGLSRHSSFDSLVTRQSESSVISSPLWFQSRLVLLGRRPVRPLLAVHYHYDYYS